MESEKKRILVPCDFTEVAKNALKNAYVLAKRMKAKILLFHVVKKEKEIVDAIEKLKAFAENSIKNSDIEIEFLAKEGNIYDTIKATAEEIGAKFVIMGTHGITGIQKFLGSKALKVIANSMVPFIVVQEEPDEKNYLSKIVVPIDFTLENKEKLRWAYYLSVYFKSKMFLHVANISNEELLKKVKANLLFAKKYFEEREVEYEINIVKTAYNFHDSVLEYSKEINANGILIMTTPDPNITDYIFAAEEQKIIANARIPVICVSPRIDTKILRGFY